MPQSEKTAKGGRSGAAAPRTVAQAADELGLSVHTIRAWIAQRRIGYLRLGRAIRVPASEIERVLDRAAVPMVREAR